MTQPKVTVFIPTYNRLEMLKVAVRSALDQGDFVQVHVLDNASTDGTVEWLKSLQKQESRLNLTLRNANVGAIKNFEEGFQKVDSEYCVPLASDDELLPNFLRNALKVAQENPSVAAVIFETEIRQDSKVLYHQPQIDSLTILKPKEHIKAWAKNGHYVSWSSILWKSSILQQFKADAEFARFSYSGDAWVQFLVFLNHPVAMVNAAGAVLNIHNEQYSQSKDINAIKEVGSMLNSMREKILDLNIISEAQKSELIDDLYNYWLDLLKNKMIATYSKFNSQELQQIVKDYCETILPVYNFKKFSFLPLCPEHQEILDINKNLKKELFECSMIKNSLSWKITAPLRFLSDRVFPR